MSEDFGIRLAKFVAISQAITDKWYDDSGYTQGKPTLVIHDGSRYVKVVRQENGIDGSVHCFVDKTNGNVLKAASWKAPAKHPRGNIFDEDNGAGAMSQWGAKYLR